jgi:hypothetical protein
MTMLAIKEDKTKQQKQQLDKNILTYIFQATPKKGLF